MVPATPLLPESSARGEGSVGTLTPQRRGTLPARRKRTGGLGLIERNILPRVILEDQKLRGGQQQGGKQRNQIGDFHETAPRVIHGAQCSPPAPEQQTRCLNDA